MRFHRLLDDVLGQRSKVALLRLLVRCPGEYTGRDLARSLDRAIIRRVTRRCETWASKASFALPASAPRMCTR
jgi:hypothetical protein